MSDEQGFLADVDLAKPIRYVATGRLQDPKGTYLLTAAASGQKRAMLGGGHHWRGFHQAGSAAHARCARACMHRRLDRTLLLELCNQLARTISCASEVRLVGRPTQKRMFE